MHRVGLNTTSKSLLSGNTSASKSGTVYSTVDYTGIALIINNPAVTTSTDTADSPTGIVTVQTATDTAFTSPTTLKTFTTQDTGTATFETYELDLQESLGYVKAAVAVTDTANATVPVSTVIAFPDRGW